MIGRSIIEHKWGDLPASKYSPELMEIFKNSTPRTLTYDCKVRGQEEDMSKVSIDTTKQYTSILLTMAGHYPVTDAHDEVRALLPDEPLVPGFYFVPAHNLMPNGTVHYDACCDCAWYYPSRGCEAGATCEP